ncbi:helix-turn-helix domain-containing protein [Nonomuraea muscovyensis]|uniref:Transcriptional regulator with XRE-family HTH domain n=1 Tax=Nonomuraea muscovyensis TaxID=1124761 RepID=A0A7X0EWX8_9ACTN|nr:helix-turn-helix domain-containing protein [Nonomuraea muscovyensis]MBB6344255.1 transcriptional regulator with XRE-family HTH domain [Nonomuraea muscovyensis]MDF2708476.1 helix-turn-helix protein [Nonomuraea muscovyensis]
MTTSDLIGLRIKTVRRQRGLSQAQLAHPELSDSYVSLIESGKRTPTPAVLELLAQKLDCSLSYLLNGVTAEQMEDIELSLGYARMALENGEVQEARTRFAELLANHNLAGLTSLRQDTQYGLALAMEACGELGEAISMLRRLQAEDLGPDRQIDLAIALCRVYRLSDRLSDAIKVGEAILGGSARPTWTDGLVELGATLLGAYLLSGDLLRARQFAAELLNAADMLGTPRAIVAACWNAAAVAESTGHGEESLTFAERALAIQSENGQPRGLARTRVAYASLKLRVRPEAVDEVRGLLLRAEEELAQTSASTLDRANTRVELARAELVAGDFERAVGHGRAAQDLLPGTARAQEAEAHLLLSRAYAGLSRPHDAERELAAVRDWLTPLPDSRREAGTWYAAAETMEQLGDADGATEAYQRALACVGL